MQIIDIIKHNLECNSERLCYVSADSSMTCQELDDSSDRLANYIKQEFGSNTTPIIVYGHKSKYMLICFLACAKSGHAYCPVDASIPSSRIQQIVDQTDSPIVFACEDYSFTCENVMVLSKIKDIISSTEPLTDKTSYVKDDEVYYIIFTSGSTGTPKGVQITSNCLYNFAKWASSLADITSDKHYTFINQAPFSFDLSVMDLYLSLYTGGTLWVLDKATQNDMGLLLDSFNKSNADVWVSTPSFADMCLADKKFNSELLPNLKTFLFCGETLSNHTANKLACAFPNSKIVNTYGPTESTVAVTGVTITPEVCSTLNPLPIGMPKPGTYIYIMDEDGNILPENERGEIIIVGDTVSSGYFKRPDLTEKAFSHYNVDGKEYRLYHTGDEGYFKDGMLYYCGRIDLQIKLHGFRIEIEDVENNVLKLENISKAVVIPRVINNTIKSLVAFVIPKNKVSDTFKEGQKLRSELTKFVPDYMIPKKFVFVDSIPMTNNGKADRRALGGSLK